MSTLVDAEQVALVMHTLVAELNAADDEGVPGTRVDGAMAAFERLRNEGLLVVTAQTEI